MYQQLSVTLLYQILYNSVLEVLHKYSQRGRKMDMLRLISTFCNFLLSTCHKKTYLQENVSLLSWSLIYFPCWNLFVQFEKCRYMFVWLYMIYKWLWFKVIKSDCFINGPLIFTWWFSQCQCLHVSLLSHFTCIDFWFSSSCIFLQSLFEFFKISLTFLAQTSMRLYYQLLIPGLIKSFFSLKILSEIFSLKYHLQSTPKVIIAHIIEL